MCSEHMVNITISVPADLKREMERHEKINWSEVARRAFEEEMRRREMKEAASEIRELREQSKAPDWRGVQEIRKWRDATK